MTDLWTKVWQVFNTKMNIPWIGTTTPLRMALFLGIFSLIVTFINGLVGNDDD